MANRKTFFSFLQIIKRAELQELTLVDGAKLGPDHFSSILLHSAPLWTLSLLERHKSKREKENKHTCDLQTKQSEV